MLASRLVQLIEDHAEQITHEVLADIRSDPRLSNFAKMPDWVLLRRFDDVIRHVNRWLREEDEEMMAARYEALGEERFREHIPLHEVVLAAQMYKRGLTRFMQRQATDQSAFEIFASEELERALSSFFDRCTYYFVKGYERALREAAGVDGQAAAAR